MSPKVVAVANAAGGSAKTTVAHALSVASVEYGKKTLLIDCDPKASLTFRVGREGTRLTLADFLSGTSIRSEDLDPHSERFDFISADSRVGNGFTGQDMKALLEKLPKEYDVVIIDTPSDINASLKATLDVADLVLVPYSNTLHQLRGVSQISKLSVDTPIKLLAVGENSKPIKEFLQWEHLDGSCSIAQEIEAAAHTTTSVLTYAKNSTVAGQLRECAYSVLEVLGLD
jgi:MinD-like ATPase involved in chromosome partitioning or flagellar assembly